MAYVPVVAASSPTQNVNKSDPGFSSLDGIALSNNDPIVLTGQTTKSENGVWLWHGLHTALSRPAAPDQYQNGNVLDNATLVWAKGGTARGGTVWGVDPAKVVTVDTTLFDLTLVALPAVRCRLATTEDVDLGNPIYVVDGTFVEDGVMATGGASTTLKCEKSCPFKASDVGKAIVVAGAGSMGADLVTTIASVSSPGVAILSSGCLTSVNPADVRFGLQLRGNGAAGSDIILLKDQDTPSENGFYWANTTGLMGRCEEPVIAGRVARVSEGDRNAHRQFKLVTQGAITLDATDVRFAPADPIFNVQDYGAIPDGVTACDDAFATALAAMQATVSTGEGPHTCLAILQLGVGQYTLDDNLVIPGNCILTGAAGVQHGGRGSTELLFAAGKGIIVPYNIDPRLGATTGATIRNLYISSPSLNPAQYVPSQPGAPTTYVVGDVVFLPNQHEYVYECIVGGTASLPPYDAWDTTNYVAPARVVPDVFNGHYYVTNSGGTSAGLDPFDPDNRPWIDKTKIVDGGGVVWFEDGLWPVVAGFPKIPLCVGFPTALETMTPDSRVVWKSGANYNLGDVILAKDGMGALITDVVFILLAGGGQTQGGAAGGGPAGGWDTVAGHTTDDGNLTWTAIDPSDYLWTDNDCIWIARAHAGIYSLASCSIENVNIASATTPKIHIRANNTPANNADHWRVTNCHLGGGTGGGIVVGGNDTNGGVALAVQFTGTATAPPLEWDAGFRDGSLEGCAWIGCAVEAAGGYGFEAHGAGHPAWVGCYSEGNAGVKATFGAITGGALGASPQLTQYSFPVVIAGQSCQNIYATNTNRDDPDDPDKSTIVTIGSTDPDLRAFIPFGIYADAEEQAHGWCWSTELQRRADLGEVGFPLGGGGFEGWWIWGWWTQNQGVRRSAFAVSGPTSENLRDFDWDAGSFWITQPYLFIGGNTAPPNCMKLAAAPPVAGDWSLGDIIWNTEPNNNGHAGWICTETNNPGTWVPYGTIEVNKVLTTNFTTVTGAGAGGTATALTFPVRSGEVWGIELVATAQCSTSNGIAYAIDFPVGMTGTIDGWLDSTTLSTGAADRSYEQLAGTGFTGTPVHTAAVATPAPDRILATITAGADGDVTVKAGSVSGGDTTTIFAGASLRARRLNAA